MNAEYEEYLNSDAWKKRRIQRLAIGMNRCAACLSKHKIQVHHLTYERIFNEPMEDLLPLCEAHHDEIEKLIKANALARVGNVTFLATETVRLLCFRTYPSYASPKTSKNLNKPSKSKQLPQKSEIESNPKFAAMVDSMTEKEFKKACRSIFTKNWEREKYMTQAMAFYRRRKKTPVKPLVLRAWGAVERLK